MKKRKQKTKVCTICGKRKYIESKFSKVYNNILKRKVILSACKVCDREKGKKFYRENKQQAIDNATKWRKENPEKFKQCARRSYEKHKKKTLIAHENRVEKLKREDISKFRADIARYARKQKETNPSYKIGQRLTCRIYAALRGKYKVDSTIKLLGCNINFFIDYLKNQFIKEMSMKRLLNGEIHLDHKIPCSAFNLVKLSEQRKCFHYSNLQPLWAADNLRKSNKMVA